MAVAADIVVEDGTGLANANSYVSIAAGDTYHEFRNNTAWVDATQDQKATALVHATQYLDLRWRFVGETTTSVQALSWPRMDGGGSILDSENIEWATNTVPTQIKNATLEYALAYLTTGRLLPDPTVPDDAGRFVTLKREKLGPLEEETRYSDSKAVNTTTRKYSIADRIVRRSGLTTSGSDNAIRA